MIEKEIFNYYLQFPPNNEQQKAIYANSNEPLYIVAGPGSGKTTLLTIRILKLILVDGIDPGSILATTFTKKAASELRSRILGKGFKLIEKLLKDDNLNVKQKEWLQELDINQIITGTIDSICEQLLRDFKEPGDISPLLIDDFISSTIMLKNGLFNNGRYKNTSYYEFVKEIEGTGFGLNINKKINMLKDLWNRRFNDLMNWDKFIQDEKIQFGQSIEIIDDALNDYKKELKDRGMLDFPMLEYEVLIRLRKDKLKEFTNNLQVIMVDEYQDTNLLQESIYFEIAKKCDGNLTVVGDDDQSLYRFRGSTVQLFSDYEERYNKVFSKEPNKLFLTTNYRSSKSIINFINYYAKIDDQYQEVRVKDKPILHYGPKTEEGIPILAMFREDIDTLGRDLSEFIYNVFRGNGYKLDSGEIIISNKVNGNLGDCALLCSSPLEHKYNGDLRLSGILRKKLNNINSNLKIFNPRGEKLTEIDSVKLFAGSLLLCIDPDRAVQDDTSGIRDDVKKVLDNWRIKAKTFIGEQNCPTELREYCEGWMNRDPKRKGYRWAETVPILELIYGLVYWFSELYNDPEGQVYLEVFTRQCLACETLGGFKGNIVTKVTDVELTNASIKELLRNIFIPIASGIIKVNEELLEGFPRDRLNVLSVHQSKGLEFPMVIVDVGADFKKNHPSQTFKRFPKKGGRTHNIEDLARKYTDLLIDRSGKDRAFDDLYRQYYVAYSRPQEILLLVGLNGSIPAGAIDNIMTGMNRQGINKLHKNNLHYI